MGRRGRRVAAAAAGVALGTAACSGAGSGPGGADASGRLSGTVTVFAAASLAEVFKAQRQALGREHPQLQVTFSFAGSPQLAAQVREGAPADVVATADQQTMRHLVNAHLVDTPTVFARNRLAIVVRPGNPKGVRRLADLGRPDLAVVLAAPQVPIGAYARRALERARVAVSPRSLELDVKAAISKVALGHADATLAYATDLRGAGDVAGVRIPDDQNVVASYPVAVVRASRQRALARAYVDDLVNGAGRAALRDHGFLPP